MLARIIAIDAERFHSIEVLMTPGPLDDNIGEHLPKIEPLSLYGPFKIGL